MKLKYLALIVVIALGTLIWSINHDQKIMESADKYEACVKAEYGVTPANWYANHGEYPTCQTAQYDVNTALEITQRK